MRLFVIVALASLYCGSHVQAQTLDQQERCAQQARRAFQEIEAQSKIDSTRAGTARVSSDYQSHYNTKLGKCLMLVETMDMRGSVPSTTAYLTDANERRMYAIYVWTNTQGKKYWEVPPIACELTPSLRQKQFCKSREEFDDFAATYMEQ